MAIHAEAVKILVNKSRFAPEVALGVAEAIEVSINLTQLVTVPALDVRLQELRHEIKTDMQIMKSELKGEMEVLRSDMKTLRVEMKGFQSEIKAELAEGLGKLSTEIQKVNANLMRWVLLTMLSSVALSTVANTILKTFSH